MLKKSLLFLAVLPLCSYANVVITGTRIIYPSEQKSISVQLTNVGDSPSLVQSWLDRGDFRSNPNTESVPFIIAPPITRVEAKAGQTLRVNFTNTESLAKDRESLFYFNLLDIPPKPSDSDLQNNPNYLQLAIRSRLKFFYRPSGLKIAPSEAYKQVKWKIQSNGINIDNQSPYYITYNHFQIGGQTVHPKEMIPPFSQHLFEAKGIKPGSTVKWSVVNDYGGDETGESPLQ